MRSLRLRHFVGAFLACSVAAALQSQSRSASESWRESESSPLPGTTSAQPSLPGGRVLTLRRQVMADLLQRAPREFVDGGRGPCELLLPLPGGGFGRFRVWDSPVMAPELASRFPDFRSFSIAGVDDPVATGRLDVTPRGLSAVVLGSRGQFFIDPVPGDSDDSHVVYFRRHHQRSGPPLACTVREPTRVVAAGVTSGVAPSPARPSGASLRIFRLALAATAEYTAAVSGSSPGSVSQALAAMVTSVNRINAIFERDLAIRLVLVAGTDQVIYTNPAAQPYSNATPVLLPSQNQSNLDARIGSANYDIGHVVGTTAGDYATLASVCQPGSKGAGATGMTSPTGDPFDLDAFAHALGHQFGAHHSFNGNGGQCAGGNRNATTAFEVGSGSTIMSYAGQCSDPSPAVSQDLAAHVDTYFHSASYDEIDAFVGTLSCPQTSPTGNAPPVIAPLASYMIPAGTPFALTASASDANGDALTYCWEEMDLGPEQNPVTEPRDNGLSPIFRSFPPTTNPTRWFPSRGYILSSANQPPATSGGYAVGELLPMTARTMNFRVTVRDNRPGGGGSDYRTMSVTSVGSAGPFVVVAPNGGESVTAGATLRVDWTVAGTSAAPVNCANVRITLSTDGGITFPYELAASVPNNGTAFVTVPAGAAVATRQARIRVEGAGNIFFDVSDADFSLNAANLAPVLSVTSGVSVRRGSLAPTLAVVGTASDANGDALSVTVSDAAPGLTVTTSLNNGVISCAVVASCDLVAPPEGRIYPLTLTVADSNGATVSGTVNVTVLPNFAPSLGAYSDISVPTTGATVQNAPTSPPSDPNGNLTGSPGSIAPSVLAGGGTVAIDPTSGLVTISSPPGAAVTTTPVRVTVRDTCGAVVVQSFNLRIVPPVPAFQAGASALLAENCVPANGAIDPGETVTVGFTLQNIGGAPSDSLTATLQGTGGITPLGSAVRNYGAIPFNASGTQSFNFLANGSCGDTVTATLVLQDGASSLGTFSFPLRLGAAQQAVSSLEHFDGVTAPALPSGWSSIVVSGLIDPWVTRSDGPDSAPNSVAVVPVSSSSEVLLTSQAFTIGAGSTQLRFRQRWNTELGFDGGVLELSVNGGAFLDVVAAGGSFVSGEYTGTLGGSNVLAGRDAWTGSSGTGYVTTLITLPASVAGQSMRLRFRLTCDDSGAPADPSWRIDTLDLIASTYLCVSCSVPPAITSSAPASPFTVGTPYVHTFTATGSPTPVFALTGSTLPPGLTLSADGLLAGTPTSAGTGVFSGLGVSAMNGVSPAATQNFTLNARTLAANYLTSFGLTGGNAALTADPNADGVPNLLAYALGLSPTTMVTNALPRVAIKNYGGVFYAMLTFNRSSVATDVTYRVEASADLNSWSTITTSVAGAVPSGAGFVGETGSTPTFSVEVRDVVPVNPATGGHRFLRLRVTTP